MLGAPRRSTTEFMGAPPVFRWFVRGGTCSAGPGSVWNRDHARQSSCRCAAPGIMKMGSGSGSLEGTPRRIEVVVLWCRVARDVSLTRTPPRTLRLSPPSPGSTQKQTAPLPVSPAAGHRPEVAHGDPPSAAVPDSTSTRRPSSPASAASTPTGKSAEQVRTFGTMTADLLALADWLRRPGRRPTSPWSRPASTGSRSITSWRAASSCCWSTPSTSSRSPAARPTSRTPVDRPAAPARPAPRSFVPPPPIRELRDLTRQRAQLVAEQGRGGQPHPEGAGGRQHQAGQRGHATCWASRAGPCCGP